MLGESILSFNTTWTFWIALTLAAMAVLVAAVRRPTMPRGSFAAFVIGLVLLSIAAGAPIWQRRALRKSP